MTEAKHTPGPHDVLGTVNLGGTGEFAFTVIGRRVGDDEAQMTGYVNLPRDVPLYTAAPDMLAAMVECSPLLGYETADLDREHALGNEAAMPIKRFRAAIAKATGAE